MIERIQKDWDFFLESERKKPYFTELERFLEEEYAKYSVFPVREDVYNSLVYTSFHDVKVVILGQDPYHGYNQAHGLSFSVKPGVKIPPSLKNMYKELHDDLGCSIPKHGYLRGWAEQGVLLLNTVLTVREGQANSHKGKGWENFTNELITYLNNRKEPIIFVLWGKPSQDKIRLINTEKHEIITSSHPSPLSAYRGFFGSKPFSKVNATLERWGKQPINWCIDDF